MYLLIEEARDILAAAGPLPTGSLIYTAVPGIALHDIVNEVGYYVPDLKRPVSHTNRPPRPGEENGLDHHFRTDRAFRKERLIQEFLCKIKKDCQYGFSLEELQAWIASGIPGQFVTTSASSAVALKKWLGKTSSLIRITASEKYCCDRLKLRYPGKKDFEREVKPRMGFAKKQNNDFDNPFMEQMVNCRVHVDEGMTAEMVAELVNAQLKSECVSVA